MSARTSAGLLIAGIALLIGSCGPLGVSAYRTFFSEATLTARLEPGSTGRTGPVRLTPGKLARIALKARIQTLSVQEVETSGSTEYKPRYRFPVTFSVTESGGRVLQSGTAVLAWNEGSRTITGEETTSTGATLTAEHSFEKFVTPDPAVIEVEARVDEDQTYDAELGGLELLVYGGLENEVPYVLSGIAMLAAGLILAIVGLVFTVVRVAASAATAASPADGPDRFATSLGSTPSTATSADLPSAQARKRAMVCHLSGFAGYVLPFGNVILAAVLWMIWRDADEFVNDQGREALNFQISVLIYLVASVVLILVLIGFVLVLVVAIVQIAFGVAAAVAASEGRRYRYPLTVRLIR